MIEAALGVHATNHEHEEDCSGPPVCIDDDTGGVALARLLAIATLTPAQAALLVTDVVDQLELAHGRGRPPIRFRNDAVMVSGAGHLTIRSTGDAGSWDEVRDAAAGLLHRIVTNCSSEVLADRVDVAIAESSDIVGLARRVRYSAATEFDDAEIGRKRSQIAALVTAVKGRAGTEDAAAERTDVPISASGRNRRHPFAGKVWHRRRRRLSKRRGILALLAVLLIVGMVWAAPTAWSELNRAWRTLLDPVESSMDDRISPVSPPAEPETGPGPVDTALPGAAGPITQVAATFASGPCEAGRSCTVRVDVRLDPAVSVGAVTWNPTVYDRCTGATLPGGDVTIPVPPGAQEAYGIGSVDLPPSSALAVAAVTTVPAATASEPMYVPSENATCSPGSPSDGG
ncbi:hypothetical protein [Rhodococcus artemisiae]|uniref:Uncharacterized protein n=1 Tax=Rhodococcus artemisiae TaxID=714159 RepID=A0ABU7LGH8_9NOCA|nr:hypothetical protein [Rhodococcus artemisiae]MEE2060665.1 hypothetical protein [Rhodococcus artemisiae]